jgi:hypothetical protein
MRSATLVLAFAVACAASPALAQARVLTAPEQAPTQALDQVPAPQAPAQDESQAPAAAPAQPPTQAQEPPPTAQTQEQTPAPAQVQAPAKTQDQIPSEAQRQDRAQPLEPGRYSFYRVDDGLLRLDNMSGKVAFCKPISKGWVCDAVPEERAALEKEIAQLRDEVAASKSEIAALKKEIAALLAPPPPPVPPQTVPPAPHSGKDGDAQIKLPTAEDVARARAFIADTWHRLVEMIENWQKDMLRKS